MTKLKSALLLNMHTMLFKFGNKTNLKWEQLRLDIQSWEKRGSNSVNQLFKCLSHNYYVANSWRVREQLMEISSQ